MGAMNTNTRLSPVPTDRVVGVTRSTSGVRPIADHYDVVVVGARVAGASTAMLLARRGLSVLAIDRGRYGADVMSTHCIAPPGILQLSRWGVLDRIRAAGTPVSKTVAFDYDGQFVEIDVSTRGDVDGLYNPRRTLLDPILVDAAVDAGADVRHGVSMVGLHRNSVGRVDGVVIKDGEDTRTVGAGIVVGADGTRSRVAAEVGADVVRQESVGVGTVYAYFEGVDEDRVITYYRDGNVVGAIPTNDAVLVWAGIPHHRFDDEVRGDVARFHATQVAAVAAMSRTMRGSTRVSGFRSFPGLPGFVRRAWGDGWVLVGDAGYFKDPVSAHGITDALIGAELVADAVARAIRCGDEVGALTHMQDRRDALVDEMMPHVAAAAALPADMDELMRAFVGMSAAMRSEWELIESEFSVLAAA
jgi:flavin-dependent dehydrogenase